MIPPACSFRLLVLAVVSRAQVQHFLHAARLVFLLSLGSGVCAREHRDRLFLCVLVTECECVACRCKIEASSSWPSSLLLRLAAHLSLPSSRAMPPSPVTSLSRTPTSACTWATRPCQHLHPCTLKLPTPTYSDLSHLCMYVHLLHPLP